jgi:hypothetical protein
MVGDGARNTFERNWCVTYRGPGPLPCPRLPAVVAPTISALTATPDVLRPANGRMVPVTIGVTVSDDSDAAPVCQITGLTNNEVLEDSDWTVNGPLSLTLRADRDPRGMGRIYSIRVTCTNASELSTSAVVDVLVPRNRR